MDEAVFRGLVIGVLLAVIGFIGDMIWKLIRSRSEGARRLKIVAGVALLLLISSVMIAAMGPIGAFGTCIVIAAIIWVLKGFKKNEFAIPKQAASPPTSTVRAEHDAAEFARVRDASPQRKTVITCPNCARRLRVLTSKYIDVTCPHCAIVFRIHT